MLELMITLLLLVCAIISGLALMSPTAHTRDDRRLRHR
ncbi:hypothetical protein C8E86_7767 [Catellatospora citrea]|nr:hypothetical protein C8E86_7767 [Catellatospora citrea]